MGGGKLLALHIDGRGEDWAALIGVGGHRVLAHSRLAKDFNVTLAPGAYTLEARGVNRSFATAPLWVAAGQQM